MERHRGDQKASPHNSLFDFTKLAAEFRLPGVDVEALTECQRKNIEAIAQANRIAFESAQAVAQRQMELVNEVVSDGSSLWRELLQPGAPEDRLAKNAEVAKRVFEHGLANARELAEIASKANTEAFDVLAKRVTESLDEMRDYSGKPLAAE